MFNCLCRIGWDILNTNDTVSFNYTETYVTLHDLGIVGHYNFPVLEKGFLEKNSNVTL